MHEKKTKPEHIFRQNVLHQTRAHFCSPHFVRRGVEDLRRYASECEITRTTGTNMLHLFRSFFFGRRRCLGRVLERESALFGFPLHPFFRYEYNRNAAFHILLLCFNGSRGGARLKEEDPGDDDDDDVNDSIRRNAKTKKRNFVARD